MKAQTLKLLSLVMLTTSLFYGKSGFALGLGQVEIQSKLGQPLSASIPLILSAGETADDVIVSIANKETFKAMKIDYGFQHNKLKTTLNKSSTTPNISITTNTPFNEPYAELIVTVKTPSQQFNRVITLLLDTPDNSDSTSVFK